MWRMMICKAVIFLKIHEFDENIPWKQWRWCKYQSMYSMMTSSNENIGEFPAQRPVTRSFGVFFDLLLNKRLSKQSWGWWFETPLCPLWRHCTVRLYPSSWHAKRCGCNCPACRTSLIATRFWVVVICPIIKCLTVLEFSFILFDLCLFITIFNFISNYVPIVTFWISTYHKIWILLIIFCFVWSYWIIYF